MVHILLLVLTIGSHVETTTIEYNTRSKCDEAIDVITTDILMRLPDARVSATCTSRGRPV